MADDIRNVVILGSGCSGLTAAVYTGRANLKPLVLEGHEPGGQLTMTTLVENFPGWPEGIPGAQLIDNLRKQAERFGAEFRMAEVTAIDFSQQPYTLTVGKEKIRTRALILATGASARWLGVPGEKELIGHGVSSCATCDGFFFSGKEIVVAGGGDSAMEEALFLTRFATKVTIVHRSDNYRASKIMLDRAKAHEKICFLPFMVIEEVLDVSQGEVTGLKLRNVKTNESSIYPTSALFLGIGHTPNTKAFAGALEVDEAGYLKAHDIVFTSVAGVFTAGDVADRHYRQAITAAGTGCMAAIEVERYLAAH